MLPLDRTVDPRDVATWIVNHIDREAGEAITHLKLQKLLYYVEAWYLANFDKPLFSESAQAWAHGPVYRSVYKKYTSHSWNALPEEKPSRRLDNDLVGYINACLKEYGQFSAKRLEALTHQEDPWKKTRGDFSPEARCDRYIDKTLIRNYYAERIGKEKITERQN